MKLTERQARLRVRAAVEASGTQMAFARTLQGITEKAAQTAVSRAVVTQEPIHRAILAALGLRRDENGDIHTVEPRLTFVAVQDTGEAAVDAAVALIARALRPG